MRRSFDRPSKRIREHRGAAALLAAMLLSGAGCTWSPGGFGYGYDEYPYYQGPPVMVFGGFYQRGGYVRRAENRGRQSMHSFGGHPGGHSGGGHGGGGHAPGNHR